MSDVNIRALARALNLSISTVSKALKDSYEISAETKQRVVALAKEMHYNPNPYASSLRRKKSNTIAVIIPEVADSFFSVALKGIEEVAQAKGYHVLLYLTYEQFEKEKKIVEECKNGRVDGVLMSVTSETVDSTHIIELMDDSGGHGVPLVFFDRALYNVEATRVVTNDYESSYRATSHLIEQGCRQLVYLSVSRQLSINESRIEGFKDSLMHNTLAFASHHIIQGNNHPVKNVQIISRLFARKKPPDGIVAGVEKMIGPLYAVCHRQQIVIPNSLKIVCFSTLPYAALLRPALTTITQPAFEMGHQAASALFRAIDKKSVRNKVEHIELPSTLYVRESSVKT